MNVPFKWKRASAPLRLDLSSGVPLDPYLVWAALISFDGYGGGTAKSVLPFLIEWSFEIDPAASRAMRETEVQSLLSSGTTTYASKYSALMLSKTLLPVLVRLLKRRAIVRFQLGAARGLPVPRTPSVFSVGSRARPLQTIGIIDDGCCLAHASFRSSKGTRFLFVWDQNPSARFSPSTPWNRYANESSVDPRYGAELSGADIDKLLAGHPGLGEASERALYRSIDRAHWGDPGRIHGACVLHALAGPRVEPLPASEPIAQDAASLPLIFVQLPNETVADTSGGSVGFYVLDGARYIARRTAELSKLSPGDWSTTINISLGSIGGPHDGTTIVERALDELVDKHKTDQVRIAVAAGNIAGRSLHAVREITSSKPGRFYVMAQPDNPYESFVELWPQPVPGAPPDASHLTVSIKSPDGSLVKGVKVGEIHTLRVGRAVVAAVIRASAVAQSERGPVILLAVRPTRTNQGGDVRPPFGVWEIEVESTTAAPTTVHAWVERNDTTIGSRGPQRTTFVNDMPSGMPCYIRDDSTLSSMANGSRTDCVGAYEVDRLAVTDYSANGPVLGTVATRPTFYGAADATRSLQGIDGPGFFTGTRARLSGTSSATPRVARWHAEGDASNQTVAIAPSGSNTLVPPKRSVGIKPPPELRRR